ncbi:MAG TPA: tetratricopeptide repeat protein [Candidatus Melainabacteria bacterium]|nr:tetratricopeptide repeat protein [Candidatus Melainabacteria bacterium]HIN63084.1 tetratricopeptide repeat protein [Candidatus Obscuribacterales bacterium]
MLGIDAPEGKYRIVICACNDAGVVVNGRKTCIFAALCLLLALPSLAQNNLSAREQWAQTHESGQRALESGNLDQAESSFKTALSQARGLGYAGPLATSLHHLGKVYYLKKQYPDAEANFKEALEIYDEQPRRNSTVLMQLVKDYAKLLRETGREAEAFEQEARIKSPEHRTVN